MSTVAGILALALAASAGDTVAFRFAWPPSLSAKVDYSRTRSRDGRPPESLNLRGRLVTESRGEETRVAFRDWTGSRALDPLVQAGGNIATIVSKKGAFVRIDGMQPALELLRTQLKATNAPPDAIARLEKMAPALLTKEASETWSLLAQFWAGISLNVGDDYLSDSEVPVAALPGEKVRIHAKILVERRLPCPSGGGGCVQVWMRSEPDPEDVSRVVKRFVKELAIPGAQVDQMLGEMSAVLEVVLVTEPERLIPHQLTKTRITRVKSGRGAPKQAPGEMTGRDVTVWKFAYAPAPVTR